MNIDGYTLSQKIQKRGQSALEFTTTYGWSFLIVLIVVGALVYFGLTTVSDKISDSCFASQGFVCKGFQISNGNQSVSLENKLGNMNFSSAKISHKDSTSNCTLSGSEEQDGIFTVECGETGLVDYSKVKVVINFYYSEPGQNYDFVREGVVRIVGTVIPSAFVQQTAQAPTVMSNETLNVSSCMSSFQSGNTYNLENSVTSNSSCFTINADSVTLDCKGKSISGSGSGSAVIISGTGNIVRNCFIVNFGTGISSNSGNSLTINSNSINSITGGYGLHLESVSNSLIESNSVSGSGTAFYIDGGSNDEIRANSFVVDTNNYYTNVIMSLSDSSISSNSFIQSGQRSGNNFVLYMKSLSGSTFSDNIILSSSKTALWVDGGSSNTLSNNQAQTSNLFPGIYVTSLESSAIVANVFKGDSGIGAQLSGSLSGSTFSNNVFEGDNFGALVFYGAASGGTFSNNLITATGDVPAVYMHASAGSHGLIFTNNQITSSQNVAVYLNEASYDNLFYNNYLKGVQWISNGNPANSFVNGLTGNRYYFNSGAGASSAYDLVDQDGDHWADSGADVPFSNETIPEYWIGLGNDSYPYVN